MPGPDELAFQLAAISQRLKDTGEGGLTRKLSQAIGKAVEPLEREIRDGLRPRLPNRYADIIAADLEVFRRTRTSGEETRVTVYARTRGPSKRKLRQLDDGILRHPLFGRHPRGDPRNRWFQNKPPSVKPGWFSGPVEEITPDVRQAIRRALDDVVREAVRRR